MNVADRSQDNPSRRTGSEPPADLAEHLPTGVTRCKILYDATGKAADFIYVYANPAFFVETGFASDIVGRPVREAIPGMLEGAPQILEWLARVVRTGSPERSEVWIPTISAWFNLTAYCTEPGVATVWAETAFQRENQMRLVKLQERLALAQTASRSGVWDWNLQTGEGYWTDELIKLFGVDPATATPTLETWASLIHPEDRAASLSAFDRVVNAGSRLSILYRLVRNTGEVRWIQAEGDTVCDSCGVPMRIVGICLDVTDTLEQARHTAALEASSQAKSSFLGTVSHELRTPLNAIIGFSSLLLEGAVGDLNEEQRRQLGIIKSAGTDLAALVSDILDFAKLEAGKLAISTQPVDLSTVIRNECQRLEIEANARSIELRVRPQDSVQVIGDPVRVGQVVRNLLSNAIKYTDKGFVDIRTQQTPTHALIEVEDTGIGISESDRDRLFSPYQRAADPGAARRTGTGLGLSISRGLVDAMGGKMGVRSESGVGSCFWVTLPLVRRDPPTP